MINISKEILREELALAQKILEKWQNKLEEGIPGQEIPASEDMAEYWVQEFAAELSLAASKLETIAAISVQG